VPYRSVNPATGEVLKTFLSIPMSRRGPPTTPPTSRSFSDLPLSFFQPKTRKKPLRLPTMRHLASADRSTPQTSKEASGWRVVWKRAWSSLTIPMSAFQSCPSEALSALGMERNSPASALKSL
jgi:hypothetical protein